MLALFIFGCLVVMASVAWLFISKRMAAVSVEIREQRVGKKQNQVSVANSVPLWVFRSPWVWTTSTIFFLIGSLCIVRSTGIHVDDNQTGIVIVKFGSDIPSGRIIATNGEKGPQAYVLAQGWHFGYWPWWYDLKCENLITIPTGKIGIVTALDGAAMPSGQLYANEWKNRDQMLDGQFFLTGAGTKGPQLTTLTPGQYRYNTRLFQIEMKDVLTIRVGEVAVVKANAGPIYEPKEGEQILTVNGTPIVPKGYRGIWKDALTPDSYDLHPMAYDVVRVMTTNRVYSYNESEWDPTDKQRTEDNSIRVRTKDGFIFPVDIRVSIKISADAAPYVVALLSNPDEQMPQSTYTVVEHRVVLPLIRAILRNAAEKKNALEFVTQRSAIEEEATKIFAQELQHYRITTDGVFIADIGLDSTEQGKALLKTQTDREQAAQDEETYKRQKQAEMTRAAMERERENANQEKNKAEAQARVIIAENDAQAKIKAAEAEAQSLRLKAVAEAEATRLKLQAEADGYKAKVDAIGGVTNFVQLETLRAFATQWKGTFPEMLIIGAGNGSSQDTLMWKWLQEMQKQSKEKENNENK